MTAVDLEEGGVNRMGWLEERNPERFSREHTMQSQNIGRGQTVYPKHELLNLAHERGLVSISLRPVLNEENHSIFIASVMFDDGTVFSDAGDATPQNCNSTTRTALPRMAATRAISRALALAMNVDHNIDVEMPQQEQDAAPAPRQTQPAQGVTRADDWEDE